MLFNSFERIKLELEPLCRLTNVRCESVWICPQVWCGLYGGPQLHDPRRGHPPEPGVLLVTQRRQRSGAARQSAGKKNNNMTVWVCLSLRSFICRNLRRWNKKAPLSRRVTNRFTYSENHTWVGHSQVCLCRKASSNGPRWPGLQRIAQMNEKNGKRPKFSPGNKAKRQ